MSYQWMRCAAAAALLLATAPALRGQDFPKISERQYVDGSAKVVVTGAFSISEDVKINTKASFSDGESTWLQFGNSGSAKPNALITYSDIKEIGISIGKGKLSATGGIMPGEKSECSGKAQVKPKLVSGKYTCHGVTSYNPATGKMSKVDIEVTFTAKG
jgi:hypothetical protein